MCKSLTALFSLGGSGCLAQPLRPACYLVSGWCLSRSARSELAGWVSPPPFNPGFLESQPSQTAYGDFSRFARSPKAHRGELGQPRTHPAILTAARLLRGLESNYECSTPAAESVTSAPKAGTMKTEHRATFGGFLGRFVSRDTNHGQNPAPRQALSRA